HRKGTPQQDGEVHQPARAEAAAEFFEACSCLSDSRSGALQHLFFQGRSPARSRAAFPTHPAQNQVPVLHLTQRVTPPQRKAGAEKRCPSAPTPTGRRERQEAPASPWAPPVAAREALGPSPGPGSAGGRPRAARGTGPAGPPRPALRRCRPRSAREAGPAAPSLRPAGRRDSGAACQAPWPRGHLAPPPRPRNGPARVRHPRAPLPPSPGHVTRCPARQPLREPDGAEAAAFCVLPEERGRGAARRLTPAARRRQRQGPQRGRSGPVGVGRAGLGWARPPPPRRSGMSGAAFPSPAAEMAEINRLQYEMEYTEGISQRMRVPEKLKVAPQNADLEKGVQEGFPNASVTMQVPERIVVAGNSEDIPLSRPPDLDLLQSTPFKPLALKTPPRVISLSDRPLDFLDLEKPPQQTPQNEEVRSVGRLKRERSMSENATRQNGQLARNDSMPVLRGGSAATTSSNPHHDNTRYGLSNLDTTLDGTPDDMTVVDAASLRRQIIKLNRRLQLLEEENKERAKREMIMYSITVAFWLLNSWLWFRR
uniref:Mitochondrial fission factor n=2 Tax=Falco TaxID=8952 RepID=A0A8C4UR73_FALTI